MRTRIPGTSGCWMTAGSECSTSVPWTGCRTDSPTSSGGWCGSCIPAATYRGAGRPSRVDSFPFSREGMRGQASRVTDLRAANVSRKLNLPPSYVLIHRVSTAGIGVLCQLGCEGPFRAEVLRWMPGYGAGTDEQEPAATEEQEPAPAEEQLSPETAAPGG